MIVTADHGEQLGEHGGFYHDDPYAEVRRVPLLMIRPGRLPAGVVIDQPVSLMDLTPTILDLLRTELARGAELAAKARGAAARPSIEVPEEARRRLRALGY